MPVVTTATTGKKALILGDNDWSRAEGLDVSALPRDASVIKVTPTATYIAGRDDPTVDAEKAVATASVWSQYYERGTLFGVYEFLERHAGVRMYFPGELGTVIPRKDALELPVGTTVDAPAFTTDRRYSIFWDGQYFDENEKGWDTNICRAKTLQSYRNRCTTTDVPCCHGSNNFKYADRFGESHPEYFAIVGSNNERSLPGCRYAHQIGQLCWTSGVVDEIYEDAKAYLTGAASTTRGLSSWGVNCRHGTYVDIMPQDGFTGCKCANCQAAYNKAEADYADGLMWGTTASIANRLRADGVDGYLTMMAYSPYKRVPDVEIPPNVLVMVACQGPWAKTDAAALASQKKLIADWAAKLGHKVWLWNYAHKTTMKGVPQFAPKAWGEFFASVAPWIDGAFVESESDKFIYNYLNYYVLGKVCWDPKRNAREIIAEHNRLMFGAAAGDMRVIFDLLERKWLNDIVGHTEETALGPVASSPDLLTLWTKVWSPDAIDHLDELFGRAAAKVADGSIEARRIAFFREQFAGGLRQASQDYFDLIDPTTEETWRAEHTGLTDIIRHGGFDGIVHSDRYFKETKGAAAVEWYGAYSPNQPTTELDEEVYHDAAPSMRIVRNPDKSENEVTQYLDQEGFKLKPDTKYRLSFFLKLKDVEPLASGGGVNAYVWDEKNVWFLGSSSNKAMCGTTSGWVAQHYEFTTGPLTNQGSRSHLTIGLRNATGTVWIDDVRLEELE